MKITRLLLPLLFIVSGFSLKAQDIHFSQYYASPLNLNPAMTGVMNCNQRIIANYRNQWSSVMKSNAYNTYALSYDQKIAVGRNDYLGVGGAFWGDVAGQSQFGQLTGKLLVSYAKQMSGGRNSGHYLVVGAEAGVSQRRLDLIPLQWGEQHDGDGGFDPTRPNQENNLTRTNFIFADVSAGILWFSVFDKNNSFYIGGAFHHLNQPNMTFYDGEDETLYSKFTLHTGGEFMFNKNVGIKPGIVAFFQGPSMEVNPGANLKFNLGKSRYNKQSFELGVWFRISNHWESAITPDAAILAARFDYNQFGIGFSYDVNVSSLRPASNSNGSFELALSYLICGPEKRGVYCPNF